MPSLKCISSQWSISIAPKSYVYQYDVDMEFGPREKLNQNYPGRPPNDVKLLTKSKFCDVNHICRHIIDGLNELHGMKYVYNERATLLTPIPLEYDIDRIIPQYALDNFLKQHLKNERAVLKILITKARTIKLEDFPTDAAITLSEDRTWRSAIEMILSEYALTRQDNQYISLGPGLMCEVKSNPFDYGLRYHDGNRKGVEVVQCRQNGPQLCLSMDFRRKVLLPAGMNFLQLIKNFIADNENDYYTAETLFQYAKLTPIYQRNRILTFKQFTDRKVRDLEIDERGITLEQFYKNWNISLQHLDEPAAIMFNGSGEFPLELLEVLPNQSISMYRMPKTLKKKVQKLNCIEPQHRLVHIKRQNTKLSLNNVISAAFGLKVDQQMIGGEYERLPRMKIILQDKIVLSNDQGSFAFEQSKYYNAAGYDNIFVFSTARDQSKALASAKKIVEEARKKGMEMPEPICKEFNTYSYQLNEWTNPLKEYKNNGSKNLVLVIDNNKESHPIVKLAQALTGVQTQHLFYHTASNVVNGKTQTCENIVHKLNIKAGGINHLVDFGPNLKIINLNETLIIAMDVCHPTGIQIWFDGDEPSTVGLVGNYLADPNEFAGLFFFQNPRQESIDPEYLQKYIKKMIQEASKHRSIKNIIIIRDGIGEGQYCKFRDEEIAAIQQSATELSMNDVKIVAVIATKDGITRHFMDVSSGTTTSMPPRSFISFGCRFGFNQFYMIAHNAFAGTAKTVMVTVIRDDLILSTSELQTFLLGLTHLHQIISSPISLPAPLYQADILAEHGQKCYQALKRFAQNDIPFTQNGNIDYVKLSNLLNFNSNGDLPLTRYTA